MIKPFIKIPQNEYEAIKKWVQQRETDIHDEPVDIQLVILYQLDLLEKRITQLESLVKTHWTN
jgi:hypothetical protein